MNASNETPDILVIGGGAIGLTAALEFARADARVTVLDRRATGQEASWAGAGIILPGVYEPTTPVAKMLSMSNAIWPVLSRQLLEMTGIDNHFIPCGGIELGFSPRDVSALRSAEGRARRFRIQWQEIDALTLAEIEPNVTSEFLAAHLVPGVCQVRNPRHLRALAAAVRRSGGEIIEHNEVVELLTEGPAASRIAGARLANGDVLRAGRYLLCAGAWSTRLLAPLGVRIPVQPVRGQMALLQTRRPVLTRVVQVGKCYLVPRRDGHLLVGSTEENVGFDTGTTEQAIAELRAFAERVCPILREAAFVKAWAGLRPGSPDGKPFVGRAGDLENLFVSTGHFRSGLQLSPACAKLTVAMMLGRIPEIPLEPFALGRNPVSRRAPRKRREVSSGSV